MAQKAIREIFKYRENKPKSKNREKKNKVLKKMITILNPLSIDDSEIVTDPTTLEICSGDKICILSKPSFVQDLLFYSFLGESKVKKGKMYYRGKVIYADAMCNTFVVGGTVRDNILMGETLIASRLQKVLKVVGLDLSKFSGGDLTEVLDQAKNFSGTERRKIVLARMLYV